MKSFLEFINEAGGQDAGKLELVKTDLKKARSYAEPLFEKNKRNLDEEVPSFDKNYAIAQRKAGMGKTKRKDMPVITTEDVRVLQKRLKDGDLDINNPYSTETNQSNPFPEGLSGSQAKKWLQAGTLDGDMNDDKVKVYMRKVAVKDLNPIQQQVYFDKSIEAIAENGAKNSTSFFTGKSVLIASSDNYIIDGHHRFLGAVLLDPNMKVPVFTIDLPINKLLPLTLAYGDAIGNKRNK